eukprot:COSAG06_NODE_4252_length_4429_cov_5.719169_3_plen_187_part_00
MNILHYQLCYTSRLHHNLTILLSASLSNLQRIRRNFSGEDVTASKALVCRTPQARHAPPTQDTKMTATRCRQCLPYVIAGVEKDVRCFSFPAGVPGADGDAAGDGADAAGAGGEKRRRGASGGGGGGRGRANCALARGADGSVVGEGRGVEDIPGAAVALLASEGARGRGAKGYIKSKLFFWIVAC